MSTDFLHTIDWLSIAWKALMVFGIMVVLWGIFGNIVASVQKRPDLLDVGYFVMTIGFGLFALGMYKVMHKRSKDRVSPEDYLASGEQMLEQWRYRVWTGFFRSYKVLTILTNQRLLAINQRKKTVFFESSVGNIVAVAKNRRSISHFSHNFAHMTSSNQSANGGPGIGLGASSGTSDGVSRTVSDIDFFIGIKCVFWMTGVNDPDSVVETISVIRKATRVA